MNQKLRLGIIAAVLIAFVIAAVLFIQHLIPAVKNKREVIAKMTYERSWLTAFLLYAGSNQGQFPAGFDQAKSFLPIDARVQKVLTPDQFEITYQGSLNALNNPSEVIVLREKQAWQMPSGKWARIYGFADGHCEIHTQSENNFD